MRPVTRRWRVGIVGASGYGGGELLRLCARHPSFEIAWVGGETSVGQRLEERFPAFSGSPSGQLRVERFEPENTAGLDLLFVSLPTGKSREPLARVPPSVRVVDVGGDHRFVEGWEYGLTELPGRRERIARAFRVANPGCYPAAALLALAPLVREGLVETEGIVVDAKSGVSGAGRGATADFGYVETNEDVHAYGLEGHVHVPEMQNALAALAHQPVHIAFTPHLVPMSRGILATCYARPRGAVDAARLYEAAHALYRDEAFVRVCPLERGRSPHTRWARASNLAFLAYAVNAQTGWVVATAAIDNLGKGAAGQALQNANLMTGQPETTGLEALPLWT